MSSSDSKLAVVAEAAPIQALRPPVPPASLAHRELLGALAGLVSDGFIADAQRGFERAPMSVRVSPYLLSLIDWRTPDSDPLRLQFIPLASRLLPDHPRLDLDSLHERVDMPVPGL